MIFPAFSMISKMLYRRNRIWPVLINQRQYIFGTVLAKIYNDFIPMIYVINFSDKSQTTTRRA